MVSINTHTEQQPVGFKVPQMHHGMIPAFQVFVNFAKDQSDDYHSKDNTVRRRDVVIDVLTPSLDRGAANGEGALRESVM